MTVVWALTWLGQSAAVATLTAASVRLPGCRASAATRHAAWAFALFICAGLLAWPFVPAAVDSPSLRFAPGGPGAQAASSVPSVALPAPVVQGFWWLGWTWALGAAAGLALTACDVLRVVCLKRRTAPLSTEEQERLGSCLTAWASSRAPRLAWCDELDSPAVLGLSGPVIALPRSQVSCLSDEPSRLVILHELAHVRRGDDWWVLAERVVLALTWVNPVMHWVWRQLSLSREMACDEWVVRQTAAPAAYATCLADVAQLRTRLRRPRLAAAVAGRPTMLRRRIAGVLAFDYRATKRALGVTAWLAPVAVCIMAAGLTQLPPMFVVAPQSDAILAARVWIDPAGPSASVPVGVPAGRRGPEPSSLPERRPFSRRQSSLAPAVPTAPSVTRRASLEAPQAEEVAAGRVAATDEQPLVARPLFGDGTPAVATPDAVPGTLPLQHAAGGGWWSGAPALATATGSGVATAGRATASFFTRFGSRVPQLFKR